MGKNCTEILALKWFVQIVGTHFHQNGHGKIVALTTRTYRPRNNLNRFQVLDINHKSKVLYSFTLVIKLDKFIYIDFRICRIQFSKSKIGLDMSLVFNVASKNLCGKTRPHRMLNTTAKNNECIVLDDDDAPMKPANTAHANKKKAADREDEEIVIVSEPILAENPFPSGK